jgi:hypothetical protein
MIEFHLLGSIPSIISKKFIAGFVVRIKMIIRSAAMNNSATVTAVPGVKLPNMLDSRSWP